MSNDFNIKNMLSSKVSSIPPSGIRKFFDIAQGVDGVISLGVGEPDFVTPWHIRETGIYSLEKGYTYYTSNWGLLELREEIAKYLKRRINLSYEPKDEILVTVGGSEAIDLCVRAIIEPGDEVLVPEPSFVCYKPCTILAGGVAVSVVTKAENNFKLMVSDLEKVVTKKTKLLILPYPNNPTGAIMEKDDLIKIADFVKKHNLIVLSDEIYSELTYSGEHISIAEIEGMQERTVLVNGFSKSYAMTGWRLGYACGHKDIISAMTKIHQYAIMSSPTNSQYAAIEALRCGDDDISYMKKEYNFRRRLIVNGLRKIGLDCFEPFGAFYAFPSIKKTGLSSSEFCERLFFEEKVAVIPGTAFGDSGEGFVRCSYAYSTKNIQEALVRIEKFINKL